nr:outer membrane protein beta-barrel domain protein [uncultured bacterium]
MRSQDQTFTVGWNVDVAANMGNILGIVAEVGGVHKSESAPLISTKTTILNLGAGPRLNMRAGSIVLFAQVVGGMLRNQSRVVAEDFDVSGSRTRWMLQPGAGVTLMLGKHWGISGELDYRRVFLRLSEDGKEKDDEIRALIGLRFGFD